MTWLSSVKCYRDLKLSWLSTRLSTNHYRPNDVHGIMFMFLNGSFFGTACQISFLCDTCRLQ